MSDTRDYGVLPPGFPGNAGAEVPWSQVAPVHKFAADRTCVMCGVDRGAVEDNDVSGRCTREWGNWTATESKKARERASAAKLQTLVAADSDRVEATRRWAVETLLDRFGSADLKDAEALVQYVLHGRTEA